MEQTPALPTPPAGDQARWFTEEVHPHGAQLKSYLHGTFPSVGDVDDVVQESYLRVWKARAAGPVSSAKSFLFSVARHVALDLLRKKRNSRTESLGSLEDLGVMDSGPNALELLSHKEKVDLLSDAIAALPDRCREVILLHKIDGLAQREVAQRLGLSLRTVEHHTESGVRHCETFLRSRGVTGFRKP